MPKGCFPRLRLRGEYHYAAKLNPETVKLIRRSSETAWALAKVSGLMLGQSTMFARGERGRMWNDRLHNQRRVLRRSPAPLGNEPSFFLRTSRR